MKWFSIHSVQYTRNGDSIVVLALFDYAGMIQGVEKEMTNTPFSEVFVFRAGEWRLLSTVWTRLETVQPAERPSEPKKP